MLLSRDQQTGMPPHAPHPWYAIRTKSNQERIATLSLASKDYDSYLPCYVEFSRRADRTVAVQRPLFPGYLFCRLDVKNRLPIMTTPGVMSILGFGNEAIPVPESEIEAIQTVLQSGAATPCAYLSKGQRIRVSGGCMEGLQGILIEEKSSWRLVVSVAMLQRSVSVEIDRNLVCPA